MVAALVAVSATFLAIAPGFAAFDFRVGSAGFFGWHCRPEWLAKVVGV